MGWGSIVFLDENLFLVFFLCVIFCLFCTGLYVSACAYSFSKRSKDSPYSIVSRFQGIFFTLFETRQILGNILSSTFLQDGTMNSTEEEMQFR
jgi:hypothetical protein